MMMGNPQQLCATDNTDCRINWAIDKIASNQETASSEILGTLFETPSYFEGTHRTFGESRKNF